MNSDTTEGSWWDNISNCAYPVDWHGRGVAGEPERKPCIRIVALKQGFVVSLSDYEDDDLAFTDAVDLVEWLLEWLGFEDEIVESVSDILSGLWDADELVDRDGERLLDIARAAQAYVELNERAAARHSGLIEGTHEYNRLRLAVKKWLELPE